MEITTLSNRGVRWIQGNWENFNFDMSIQRHGGLWKPRKKTMLIHTLIAKYPSNSIFCVDIGDKKYEFIEGKQRMNTVKEYLDDEFALTEDILDAPVSKDIDLDDLVGKKFSELNKQYQDRILDYSFQYKNIIDATEEEIEEIMFRLNDGTPMSAMELTRIKVGQKVRDYLYEVAGMPFWKEKVNLSQTDYQRFVDQELVLQVMSLAIDKEINFSAKDIRNFGIELKDNGISDEIKNIMVSLSDYLDKAFPEPAKALRKVNVSGISKVALQAIEEKINPITFGNIVLTFLNEQNDLRKEHKKDKEFSLGNYNEAIDSGSGKQENIGIRIHELKLYYEEQTGDLDLKSASGL
jgi:hypothetical protein